MPQTAASLDERVRALEALSKNHREIGWQVCVTQFETGSRLGQYSHRPRWRGDASGAGQVVTTKECYEFTRKAVDISLAWPEHDERTLGDLVERLQGLSNEHQANVWNLISRWVEGSPAEDKKAALRERVRRYAFTRRSAHRNISKENADRARLAYEQLSPRDPITRHRWLFAAEWVEESFDELEERDFSFETRARRIKQERKAALHEIWGQQHFQGIEQLVLSGDAGRAIGALMSEVVRGSAKSVAFVRCCLEAAKGEAKARIEWCLRGYLYSLDPERLTGVVNEIAKSGSDEDLLLIFLCMPFSSKTWRDIDAQGPQVRDRYWQNVISHWDNHAPEDVTELLDTLLEAKRPLAAFHAVHMDWEKVETTRLIGLLRAVAISSDERPAPMKLSQYRVSKAFSALHKRQRVTTQEKAQLEFMYLDALSDRSEHGIPNLEQEIARSPDLYMQAIATTFLRRDDGSDPPEWRFDDKKAHERAARSTYRLLNKIKRIPGTDKNGTVKVNDLKEWLSRVRELCRAHGRAEIGDQMIGQLLARAPVDETGVWPCRPVCEAMQWMSSEEVGRGFNIATRNARSVHWHGEGGRSGANPRYEVPRLGKNGCLRISVRCQRA